ncbi:MAG: hypothetical protein JW981_09890, partial [Anaerolineae bacterium]|nr:hypothetical protein [Anaerolineae bacterium]
VPTAAPLAYAGSSLLQMPHVDAVSIPADARFRIGVSMPMGATDRYNLPALGIGWTMDWSARAIPQLPGGIAYAQTVRMSREGLSLDRTTLTAIAQARPHSLWLISNEPDVRWQDNVPADTYARLYYDAYTAIKTGDPTAVVAAGGISQPSPMRMHYLDQVLSVYQAWYETPLPADAWHIHNYMLREERDSWGVDIPPGIIEDTGLLYDVEDSGDLAAFRLQIYDFRRWMAERGYRETPLIISEYGVTMPEDYGFPPERVLAFLMNTTRFFLDATDPEIGYPLDQNRLVQKWCWFSLAYYRYPTGDLIDVVGETWTPLGAAWIKYLGR